MCRRSRRPDTMTTPTDVPAGTDRHSSAEPAQDKLVADIERTRERLGDTVDELSARLSVKQQARARVDATRRRLHQQAGSAEALSRRPDVRAVTVALVAIVCIVVFRRRR
jgi:hypothetical protein